MTIILDNKKRSRKLVQILQFFLPLFLFLSAMSSVYCEDYGSLDYTKLIGWTADGKLLAYEKSFGYWSVDREKNWTLRFIVVERLPKRKIESIFQVVKSSVPQSVEYNDKIKKYNQARPFSEWAEYIKKHQFVKPEATPFSPTLKWKIVMQTENNNVSLITTPKPSNELSELTPRVPGIMLEYRANWSDYFEGEWPLFIKAISSNKEVVIGKDIVKSYKDHLEGRFYGYLAVYWGPDGRSVAVEWTWGPVAGGSEYFDLIIGVLQ